MYQVILQPDDNGMILVTCPALPEVTTFGEDEEDAAHRAIDAIEEALAARIERREEIPKPAAVQVVKLGRRKIRLSPTISPQSVRRMVRLPPLIMAKVELYRTARDQGISKAELARRLGWHGPQVDRLFDLNHRSTIEHIDHALHAVGKRLAVSVENAA